jgi:hypothetical protein
MRVDYPIERFGGLLPGGSMPMSSTQMRSQPQIRATARATDPSAFAFATVAVRLSRVNQQTLRSASIATCASPDFAWIVVSVGV